MSCILLLPRRNWEIKSGRKLKQSGNVCGQKIAVTVLLLMHPEISSLKCAVESTNKMTRELGFFREKVRCTENLCFCTKTYCCYDAASYKFKFSSKGFSKRNKRVREQSGNGTLDKYRRVLDKIVVITSTSRGPRTNKHTVATYEQVKRRSSYFNPNRTVESDGNHAQPLNL